MRTLPVTLLRLFLLVAALAVGVVVLAACSSGDDGDSGAAVPPTAIPKEAKIMRVSFGVAPVRREWNIPRHGSQPDSWQMRPMYEYLVGVDRNTGQAIPRLATEWSLEPDGHSWRFKLRKGVQFHNNWGEFTAKDVKHTHDMLVLEDSEHGQAFSYRRDMLDVEIVNDYEVIIRTRQPDFNFFGVIGEQEGGEGEILSKAHFDAEGEPKNLTAQPTAGTGPYQYDSRAQEQFLRYKRVPYEHWRVTPDFEEFEFRWQAEASTRLAALLTGEVQMASIPIDLQQLAIDDGKKLIQGRVPGLRASVQRRCCWVDPDTGAYPAHPNSPLTNVLVRKALDKAVNLDELNKAFMLGKGQPMYNSHWIEGFRQGWNPDWERNFQDEYGYDPAAARQLLAEAGYGPNNPMETSFQIIRLGHMPGLPDWAEAIAGYYRDIGVKVTLTSIDSAAYRAMRRNLELDNFSDIWVTSSGHQLAYGVFHTPFYSKTNSANYPATTALYAELRQILDPVKQDRLWRQIGDLAYKQHLTGPLFWLPAEVTVNPEFITDWEFPGSITSTWTHVEYLKAVLQ